MCIFIYCFSNRKRKRGFSIVKEPSFILWKFKLLSGLCKLYKFGWVFPINIQLHCFHLSCQRGSNSCTFKHFKISLAGAVATTPPSCQAKTKSQQNKAKWSKILPADLTKLFCWVCTIIISCPLQLPMFHQICYQFNYQYDNGTMVSKPLYLKLISWC